jgi:plastocyanin
MRRIAVLAALAAVLVAAGPPGRGDAAPTTPRQVTISDFAYTPDKVVVQVGESVQWTNVTGGTKHTVTADNGAFDSNDARVGGLDAGLSYSHIFTQTGEYAYHCTIHTPTHPGMKGTLVVEPATTSTEQATPDSGQGAASGSGKGSSPPIVPLAIVFVVLVAGAFTMGRRPPRGTPPSGGRPKR